MVPNLSATALVPLQADDSAERDSKRSKPYWRTATVDPLTSYDSQWFHLHREYAILGGLYDSISKEEATPLYLFRRPAFEAAFQFLHDVLTERREAVVTGNPFPVGWVLGPPGCGKSTAVMAFLSQLSRDVQWVCTWLHLSKSAPWQCMHIRGNQISYTEFEKPRNLDVLDLLNATDVGGKSHFVVLDSVRHFDSLCTDAVASCLAYLGRDFLRRRLAIVSSLSSRGKPSDAVDMKYNIKVFRFSSWTEAEYLEAIKNDSFFESVKGYLDAACPDEKDCETDSDAPTEADAGNPEEPDEVEVPEREVLVRSKAYFAGGSSRYMFDLGTKEVMSRIMGSFASVGNIILYLEGKIGDQAAESVNRLLGCSLDSNGEPQSFLISRYANTVLAMKASADIIKRYYEVVRGYGNPAMEGWMFEMEFFHRLPKSHRGLTVKLADGTTLDWEQCPDDIPILDPTSVCLKWERNRCWYRPSKFNQGGYDAVFLDISERHLIFVQATIASRHSFALTYFGTLVKNINAQFEAKSSARLRKVDIYFIVPSGKRAGFSIKKPTGRNSLCDYGFVAGQERKSAKIGEINWTLGN